MRVVLDSNLLLLLVIGHMEREAVTRFKRTQQFSLADFDRLVEIVSRTGEIVTTPHVLTEVSSLANALRDDQKNSFAIAFRSIIERLREHWQEASTLAPHRLFRFGIADVACIVVGRDSLLLTQDGRLAAVANASGGFALSLQEAIALGNQLL